MKTEYIICFEDPHPGRATQIVLIASNPFDTEEKALSNMILLLGTSPERKFYIMKRYSKD